MGQEKKLLRISEEQWAMPVSLSTDGARFVTLREYINSQISRIPLEELTFGQRAEVTIARIEKLLKFEIATLNIGVIGKERAISEIRANTVLGKNLIEIEQRVIKLQLESILDESKAE